MKPSNQIGGKGSVRRKVINTKRRNFAQKRTQEQLHLENKIKRINEYINEIDSDYIELAKDCIDEIVYTYFGEITRYDMKSKAEFKELKKDYNEFFDDKFINMNNIKVKTTSYITLKNLFIKDCMPHVIELFTTIENALEKKDYEKQEGDVEEMTDKECFDILELDVAITPTKNDLRKAFRKKSFMYHPDKQTDENKEEYGEMFKKVSVAYKLIKNRYNL